MKVFNDLDLVEQMGTGIIRILQSYDKKSFEFFPNFIRVTFPFNKDKFREEAKEFAELTETQKSIINLMLDSPTITQETLSNLLGINIRTVQRNIKTLIEKGLIERTGATKKGEWIVKN